jgi:hypothetical protein
MTITGEPAALEKYNFNVGKGRVTGGKFGGDSMGNFFKGSVSVGDKKKADKDYFQNFSIAGGHLADKASFLQSGAWGLDQNAAGAALKHLEEEAKKLAESKTEAKKDTEAKTESKPQLQVSDLAKKDQVDSAQKPNEPAQDIVDKEKDAEIQAKPADIKNPPNVVHSQNQAGVVVNKSKEPVTNNVVAQDPSVIATSKQPLQATKEQLEAKLKALESGYTKQINSPGVGLPNGANNCFQNAALAALRGMGVQSTAENALRLQNYLDGKVTTYGQALALREEVAQKMELPNEIKDTISEGSYLVQHDAVEVLEALLDKSNMPEVVVENKTEHKPSNGGSIFSKTGEEKSKILKLPVPADSEEIPMQNLIQSLSQLSFVNDVQFEGLKK